MTRKKHEAAFKAKLVLEAIQEQKTLNQIASENDVHPNLLTRWKTDAIKGLPQLFLKDAGAIEKQQQLYERKIEELYTQIGKLTIELDWLKKKSKR